MAPIFNQALKAGHVGFVTDTYKVLQTFSQRITWVFCSTMVYATKGAPFECQQHWPEYGGRDLQQYTVQQIVTLPICRCVSNHGRLFLSN